MDKKAFWLLKRVVISPDLWYSIGMNYIILDDIVGFE